MPPSFTVLYGEHGFGVVVPDFTPASMRKAARLLWEEQVTAVSPFSYISEFTQLIKAGQKMTWYRYSDADPEVWGERWGEDGDLLDESISVVWFLNEDIPGSYAWTS